MKTSVLPVERKQGIAQLWPRAHLPVTFPQGRIDVYSVRLDEPATSVPEATILSPDERARSQRFHFEKDRIHFCRCRAALRELLAGYLASPAEEIRFEYMASGKPQLAPDQNLRGLQFNVSHSANMGLIAIGSGHRLGVDIERIRADVDTNALAERFFSLRERAGLKALPAHLRVPAFFACWTRKEAFLKATGDGLSFPLADFSVSTDPENDPELEEITGNVEVQKKWFLSDLKPIDGFRAAVAVESSKTPLETYAWN
jgi:4'-phosphopantetheinyl transferase